MKTSYIVAAIVVVVIIIGAGVYLLYPTGSVSVTSIVPTSTFTAPLEPINATVTVSNTKSSTQNFTFTFSVDGVVQNTTTFTLAPNTTQNITFSGIVFNSTGSHSLAAGTLTESIRVSTPIFADVRVREAFQYAFDDKTFIAEVLKGGAIVPNGPVPQGMNGYDPNAPTYTYNLTLAKELLLAAGADYGFNASNPLHIPLYYNEGNTAREDGCLLLASAINGLNTGLVIDVSALSWPQFVSAEEKGQLPLFYLGWAPDYVDADDYLTPFCSGTVGIYATTIGYNDPVVTALVANQSTITNTTLRQQTLDEIYSLVYNDSPYIWTDQAIGIHFQSSTCIGYYFNPAYPGFDFANMSIVNATHPYTITYETIGSYQYLDPATDYETSGGNIIQNVYENLLYFNGTDSSSVIPWLASSYNVSSDGMTYTFNLRQGITFQDGTPFNASAVVFSIERAIIMNDPTTPAWMLAPIRGANNLMNDENNGVANMSEVAAWEATNPVQAISNYVVQINLDHPYAPFPLVLAFSVCAIVSPSYVLSHGGEPQLAPNNHNPVMDTTCQAGTGPYIMNANESTPSIVVLDANPHYWGGPSGTRKPQADHIIISTVPDPETELLDLQTGKCQLADISRDYWYTFINQTLWLDNDTVQAIYPGIAAYGPNYSFDIDFIGFNFNF